MNLRSSIVAVLLASLIGTTAVVAHDPNDQEHGSKEMKREPAKIQPAPPVVPPVAAPAVELPKIRFHEMDRNGNRKITRKEWRGKSKTFRKLDVNKDGVLSGVEVEVPVKVKSK